MKRYLLLRMIYTETDVFFHSAIVRTQEHGGRAVRGRRDHMVDGSSACLTARYIHSHVCARKTAWGRSEFETFKAQPLLPCAFSL